MVRNLNPFIGLGFGHLYIPPKIPFLIWQWTYYPTTVHSSFLHWLKPNSAFVHQLETCSMGTGNTEKSCRTEQDWALLGTTRMRIMWYKGKIKLMNGVLTMIEPRSVITISMVWPMWQGNSLTPTFLCQSLPFALKFKIISGDMAKYCLAHISAISGLFWLFLGSKTCRVAGKGKGPWGKSTGF
jgi:hypothetical protein